MEHQQTSRERQQEIDHLEAAFHSPPTPLHREPEPLPATSYRDTSPLPRYGTTPPVAQPDSRVVPAWAAGIAVASIGVGAGATGLGCAAWLVLRGLASVTLNGVLLVTLPVAAAAALATAVGGVISRLKTTAHRTTNNYNGPVNQRITNTTAKGVFARSRSSR